MQHPLYGIFDENARSESNEVEKLINPNRRILQNHYPLFFKISIHNSPRVSETENIQDSKMQHIFLEQEY